MATLPNSASISLFVLLLSACGGESGDDTSSAVSGGQGSGTAAGGGSSALSGGTAVGGGSTSSGGTASTVATTGGLLDAPITTCTAGSCRELLGGSLDGVDVSIVGTGAGMARWTVDSGWMVAYGFNNGGFALLEGTGELTSSGPQPITRGVVRMPNEQPNGGTWYCVGAGSITGVYTLELANLSRLGGRSELSETTDWLSLIQTWSLLEETSFEGVLDGAAFTATSQWGGSGPVIVEQGFLGANGQSGYFWSWLALDEQDVVGIYDGAAVFLTSGGYQVRLGGAASAAYSETANDAGVDGQRVHVELKNLIGPLSCPGTDTSGSLSGVVYE